MDVLMPQLGETVAEGKVTKWFKSVGDKVAPGDNLFEIETDKTSMEVPATSSGTLTAIHFGVGEVAKVGAVVAVIAGTGVAAAPQAAAKSPAAATSSRLPPMTPMQATQAAPRPRTMPLDPWQEVKTPERNFGPAKLASGAMSTPLARRLAGEGGIDASSVSGSGPHGRVVARDVEAALGGGARMSVTPAGSSAAQVKALYADVPYDEVPLDNMRRTIAKRLIEAKQTIPHFYLTADLDVDRLVAMREEANTAAPKDQNGQPAFKLSLNDFIIKAWASALQRVPAANAVWAEDRILRFLHSDIGVAVAIDNGLLTPVIRMAEAKSLTMISAEMNDLVTRARARKLKPNEYQGGASAISNLGMYGVREFSAIINPPHATIIAVGGARRQAVETEDGGVKFISQMSVTLSCDHRVVDGALGAQLLAAFKGFIEKPVTALV
ncbi:MAG: dihydrolipoamide acetyltransferase family protein [Hyphomicrobiales bacterium]